MEIKNTKTDLIWAILGTALNLMMGIIVLPVMLIKIDEIHMGLWYIFAAIQSFVALLDFGFSPTYTRNVTYAICGLKKISKESFDPNEIPEDRKPNFPLVYTMLKTGQKIYRILMFVALGILCTAGLGYYIYIIPDRTDIMLYITFAVFVAAMLVNMYYTYLPAYMRGLGAVKQSYQAYVAARLVYIVLGVALLYCNLGLLGMMIALLCSGIVLRIVSIVLLKKYCKKQGIEVGKDMGDYSTKEVFSAMWHNTKKEGLIAISNFITSQAATFFCSAYFGLAVSGSYGLTLQVLNVVASVGLAYFSIITPRITQYRVSKEQPATIRMLSKSMAFLVGIFAIGMIGICFGGPWFLNLIHSNTKLLPIWMVLCFGITLFLEKNCYLIASYISTSNRLPYMLPYIVSAGIILLGYGLLPMWTGAKFGVIIFCIVQFSVQMCFNDWYWHVYVGREFHQNTFVFYFKGFKFWMSDIINGLRGRKKTAAVVGEFADGERGKIELSADVSPEIGTIMEAEDEIDGIVYLHQKSDIEQHDRDSDMNARGTGKLDGTPESNGGCTECFRCESDTQSTAGIEDNDENGGRSER